MPKATTKCIKVIEIALTLCTALMSVKNSKSSTRDLTLVKATAMTIRLMKSDSIQGRSMRKRL